MLEVPLRDRLGPVEAVRRLCRSGGNTRPRSRVSGARHGVSREGRRVGGRAERSDWAAPVNDGGGGGNGFTTKERSERRRAEKTAGRAALRAVGWAGAPRRQTGSAFRPACLRGTPAHPYAGRRPAHDPRSSSFVFVAFVSSL